MATAIGKAPNTTATSHTAPTRDGNTVKSTWKVPSQATNSSNARRATSMVLAFELVCKDGTKTMRLIREHDTQDMSPKQDTMNLGSFSAHESGKGNKSYSLASFWPSGDLLLKSIEHRVIFRNWNGEKWQLGSAAKVSATFSLPGKPSIGGWKFDPTTGTLSCKITAAEDKPRSARSRTQWTATAWVKKSGKSRAAVALGNKSSGSFAGASSSWSYDYASWQALANGEYLVVRILARSQGLSGNSDWEDSWYVLAPPAQVGVNAAKVKVTSTNANGRLTVPVDVSGALKTVTIKGKSLTINKVDGMSLQAAVGVDGKPGADDWEDAGPVDDGQGKALTAMVASLVPPTGLHTWVRVKSWRITPDQSAQPFHRYSTAVDLKELYEEGYDADDAACEIVELSVGSDGTSASITVAYDSRTSESDDTGLGTEVSWSTHRGAWTSTDQPDTFEVTWRGNTSSTDPYYSRWKRKHTLTINGLELGQTYYFRARRYGKDATGEMAYGSYAKAFGGKLASLHMAAVPDAVALAAPPAVARGEDLRLSWVISAEAAQSAWRIICGPKQKRSGGRYVIASPKVLAVGADQRGACIVDWATWSRHVGSAAIYLAVEVATGGDYVTSDVVAVRVADRPRIELTGGTVTAMPATVTVLADKPALEVALVASSRGDGGDAAIGRAIQAEGDDVWSYSAVPSWASSQTGFTPTLTESASAESSWSYSEWSGGAAQSLAVSLGTAPTGSMDEPIESVIVTFADEAGDYTIDATIDSTLYVVSGSTLTVDVDATAHAIADGSTSAAAILSHCTKVVADVTYWPYVASYEATITAPTGIDWRDGATYDVVATATDPATGLASEQAESSIVVDLTRKAPAPSEDVTVTPYDTTDEQGVRTIGATVTLMTPATATTTDTCDVLRVGTDGAVMIAEGVDPSAIVTDPYAPFGDGYTAYRVVTRTTDNDVDWLDVPYSMPLGVTRIDYGGEYIELPYNLKFDTGKYSKDFEQRQHLGQALPEGYWGGSHTRTLSISSALVRQLSADDRRKLHDLGRHMGPCLVRTPDGCCAYCDVTVDGMQVDARSSAVGVAVSCREIEPDGSYAPTITVDDGEDDA